MVTSRMIKLYTRVVNGNVQKTQKRPWMNGYKTVEVNTLHDEPKRETPFTFVVVSSKEFDYSA